MHWIAPSEKDPNSAALEKLLWDTADQFRANSGLKSQEYSAPVLGLIFLRFAEVRFAAKRSQLESPPPLGGERAGVRGESGYPHPLVGRTAGGEGAARPSRRGSRVDEPAVYHAECILYLPAEARFDYLLNRPEVENIGAKVLWMAHAFEKPEEARLNELADLTRSSQQARLRFAHCIRDLAYRNGEREKDLIDMVKNPDAEMRRLLVDICWIDEKKGPTKKRSTKKR